MLVDDLKRVINLLNKVCNSKSARQMMSKVYYELSLKEASQQQKHLLDALAQDKSNRKARKALAVSFEKQKEYNQAF